MEVSLTEERKKLSELESKEREHKLNIKYLQGLVDQEQKRNDILERELKVSREEQLKQYEEVKSVLVTKLNAYD
jgi:hypothetical protein